MYAVIKVLTKGGWVTISCGGPAQVSFLSNLFSEKGLVYIVIRQKEAS